MINEHTVDCHPSPSQLTSKIHPLIFLWTFKKFMFPKYFLNFFSNLYISQWFRKSLKFMMLRLLANTLVSQKIDSVHFYLCPQAKTILIITRRQNEIIHFSQTVVYEDLFFHQQKGEGLWSCKNN